MFILNTCQNVKIKMMFILWKVNENGIAQLKIRCINSTWIRFLKSSRWLLVPAQSPRGSFSLWACSKTPGLPSETYQYFQFGWPHFSFRLSVNVEFICGHFLWVWRGRKLCLPRKNYSNTYFRFIRLYELYVLVSSAHNAGSRKTSHVLCTL